MTEPSQELHQRWGRIRERIADAGGDPERITLLAVSKGVRAGSVEVAVESGLADLGESYAQELVAKADDLSDRLEQAERPNRRGGVGDARPVVRWHFIGGLQRNKVRLLAPYVHLWQSVDRLSLAAEIARRAPGATVLVQVNVSGNERQSGCPPERVAAVVEGCTDLGLAVRGLMAIGPQGADELVRAAFRTVRELADRLALPERSMGMSGDLEVAVAEGSTMVRIGSALFGPRSSASAVGT